MKTTQFTAKTALSSALVTAILMAAQSTQAAGLTIGQEPLFLTEGVAPNLLVTLDDSGSMNSAYAPDGISGRSTTRRFRSSDYNPMYYNPNTTYARPKDVTFNSRTGLISATEYTTSYTQAYINGFKPNLGSVNLSNGYFVTRSHTPNSSSQSLAEHPSSDFSRTDRASAAYYYVRDNSLRNCNGTLEDDDCYRLVWVSSAEQENFANWYSFYRTRTLATASAANLAFLSLPENVRVTWQMLNTCTGIGSGSCRGAANSYSNYLRNFANQHREGFFSWLADLPASGGTPLRAATQRAGNFLSTTGVNGPWSYEPGTTTSPQYSCRSTYHILMTDGVWNENTTTTVGNADGTSRTLPDGTAYTPRAPFRDGASRDYGDTLADLAFKYWAEDANTNLANGLKPFIPVTNANPATQYWDPRNNPATWQHMVTYTLGLGLTRSLTNPAWGGSTFEGDYDRLRDGLVEWPQPASNQSQNVYELWHAALNSRGEFFSVDSPNDMVTAFQTILNRIAARDTSASAASLESAVATFDNEAYYARFSSKNWSGELVKYDVDSNGLLTFAWNARDPLDSRSPASRTIMFNQNGTLQPFLWSNLSTAQQTTLNRTAGGVTDTRGESRVNYIRGDRSLETSTFRTREHLLGDIIHSSPIAVGAPDRVPNLMDQAAGSSGAQSYNNFALSKANRAKRIYVGANDGMLHAFDASGREVFAYVPTAVIEKLNLLTDKSYTHQFYVDGTPVVSDIFDGTNWRTILVGTLRGGGRSVFALDITDPNNISLLWEFSSTADADLGFTFPEPIISKLHNGKWGVILANGYNSTNDRAALFILDAVDGTVTRKFTVGTAGTINGLSSPRAVDINGDLVTDYVYAGDLTGNLWRFDLFDASKSSPLQNTANVNASTFKVAFGGNPLYTALASDGSTRQPITAAPALVRHPSGTGYIVGFGTGKYFETTDSQANTSVAMSLYGIWDRQTAGETASSTPSVARSNLVAQTISTSVTSTFTDSDNSSSRSREIRTISKNPIQWMNGTNVNKYGWFLDLKEGNTLKGELVTTPLTSRGNVLLAATTVPNSDPCSSGIDRWFLAIDGRTGGATDFNVLDLTGNNYVTADDSYNGQVVSSVRIPGFGSPAVVGSQAFFNTDGGVQKEVLDFGPTSRGRQTWRVLGE
ncbi:pilus assembly protein [Ectopseudomonas khazarica]|uniref:pilus assembly protein n=1 Tax=Ectopseudomonas khazarica TaxID=2502979 RepID=UPI00384BDBE5